MTEKQNFTDTDLWWKMAATTVGIGLGLGFLWIGITAITGGVATDTKWVVFAVLFLMLPVIAFFGHNLTTNRKVSCDAVGCLVTAGKNWGSPQIDNFKWGEVTGTGISVEVITHQRGGNKLYYLAVGVGGREVASSWSETLKHVQNRSVERGREIRLLRYGAKDFTRLLAVVGEKTPQLPYLWIEREFVNNHAVLQEVGPFCKIARD